MMVDTHSYMLSPLGPAEQLQGGSRLISASSFCILLPREEKEGQGQRHEEQGVEQTCTRPARWYFYSHR